MTLSNADLNPNLTGEIADLLPAANAKFNGKKILLTRIDPAVNNTCDGVGTAGWVGTFSVPANQGDYPADGVCNYSVVLCCGVTGDTNSFRASIRFTGTTAPLLTLGVCWGPVYDTMFYNYGAGEPGTPCDPFALSGTFAGGRNYPEDSLYYAGTVDFDIVSTTATGCTGDDDACCGDELSTHPDLCMTSSAPLPGSTGDSVSLVYGTSVTIRGVTFTGWYVDIFDDDSSHSVLVLSCSSDQWLLQIWEYSDGDSDDMVLSEEFLTTGSCNPFSLVYVHTTTLAFTVGPCGSGSGTFYVFSCGGGLDFTCCDVPPSGCASLSVGGPYSSCADCVADNPGLSPSSCGSC